MIAANPALPRPFPPLGSFASRCLCVGLVWLTSTVKLSAASPVNFNRDIRPLLSDACFQCHGPDEQQRRGGLRLDQVDWSQARGDSGALAITPATPSESELLSRLKSTDPQEQMPPPNSGKKLTPAQIELIERWIAEGASTTGHWAFHPPVRPAVPTLENSLGVTHPVDRFLVSRMRTEGLTPAPEADRTTLIRRVTLDLTGLPPTPDEVDAFLSDNSPQAWNSLVDRLLASPRFGEHFAQTWLDFARYADSNGFQIDSSRQMWPWRDWVIEAFNRNLPFDQFTIEQLAGDLLPDSQTGQKVATGFLRNHRLNGEGGIIAEEWRVETVIDRVETVGLTWLGLTLNCCRCHDHKYDPLSQREFYSLFSFFNNVPESGTLQGESRNTEPVLPVPTLAHTARLAELAAQLTAAEAEATRAAEELPELVRAWEPGFRKQLTDNPAAWRQLEPKQVKSLGGAILTRQPDGTWLASGDNPAHDTYEVVSPLGAGLFSGLLLETFPDASLPMQSLGRFPNGNYVLSRIEAEISAPSLPDPVRLKVHKVAADYSQSGWDISLVLSGDRSKGWAVDGPTRREPRKAMFLVESEVTVPADATLTIRLFHEAINQHNIGRFRMSATGLAPASVTLDGPRIPESIRQIVSLPTDQRTPAQEAELRAYFRATADSPVRQADVRVAKIRQEQQELPKTFPNVMVMVEGPVRETRVLRRGQYDQPGEPVKAGVPAVLPPLPEGVPVDRLALARWMVSPQHPLTARVWVNRAWERFFGTGLVKTTENLGSQAEYPSHPELLDWLACEFMQPSQTRMVGDPPPRPWDMKAFLKLLLTSQAYRQSSAVTPHLLERDPDNRLLARGPRFRLSAEALRDQALAISGLLQETVGGPSVRPYMPEGVWDETSRYGDLLNYRPDGPAGLYRRTLYTIWKRTAAPPTMLLFDAPNREVCTVRRSRTNTPLQALALLNEVTYVEAARKLAERMLQEGGPTDEDRLRLGFRLATSRRPTSEELDLLLRGLAVDRDRYRQAPAEASKLVSFGMSPPVAGLATEELAAWTLTANTLLNLDEVTTRE
jgi:hypothetical protein